MFDIGKSCRFWRVIVAIVVSLLLTPSISSAQDREDPLISFKYGLEVEGKLAGFFSLVSGIGSESEIVEHKIITNTGVEIIQKIPGRLKWLDVVLTRGITSDLYSWEWRKLVENGNINEARTDFSIIAYNQVNEEIARWNFKNGWPMKISAPEPKDTATAYMVETLIIAHEGYERIN